MIEYPRARDLRAEIEAIRAYTKALPELTACHHFSFDLRLGSFERAEYIVMGMNPGETASDLSVADGPCEESSLVDYRHGVDSRSRRRWFSVCKRMLGTDQIALSELCFWSSSNPTVLAKRIGPPERSPHLIFCRTMNERLIAFHRPRLIACPGLGWLRLARDLYGLEHVNSQSADNGDRLIEHYQRGRMPWVFTKHWSGARGFTRADKGAIRDYLQSLAVS